MPFNGSGTYVATSLPGSWNPATTGSSATPADWNTLLTDLSTALSTAICKDGQTTITGDIPFATHKITGLGNATALTDAVNRQGTLFLYSAQSVTGVAFVDFTNIPSTFNNLRLVVEMEPSAQASFQLQTYDPTFILNNGGTDYGYLIVFASNSTSPTRGSATTSFIGLTDVVDATALGTQIVIDTVNIQAAHQTKFTYQSFYGTPGGNTGGLTGGGFRSAAQAITGIRLLVNTGTMTGTATLYASV